MLEYSADIGMGVTIFNCQLRDTTHGTLMFYSLKVHDSVVIRRRLVKPEHLTRLRCRDIVTRWSYGGEKAKCTTTSNIAAGLLKLELKGAAVAYAALLKASRQSTKHQQEQS